MDAVKLLRFSLALHGFDLLTERKLDVARGRHVRVDTTVRTVGTTALSDSLVHLDVVHAEGFNVQALGLWKRAQKERQRLVIVRAILSGHARARFNFDDEHARKW